MRKLLGFIMSHNGIEANPKNIRAFAELKFLCTFKEIPTFTGKLAAMNRFISQVKNRCRIFF